MATPNTGYVKKSERYTSAKVKDFIQNNRDKLFFCPAPACEDPFPTARLLQRHVLWHKNLDAFTKCDRCSERFSQPEALACHKAQFHSPGHNGHVCINCNGRFTSRLCVKRHRLSCTKPAPVNEGQGTNWAVLLAGKTRGRKPKHPHRPALTLAHKQSFHTLLNVLLRRYAQTRAQQPLNKPNPNVVPIPNTLQPVDVARNIAATSETQPVSQLLTENFKIAADLNKFKLQQLLNSAGNFASTSSYNDPQYFGMPEGHAANFADNFRQAAINATAASANFLTLSTYTIPKCVQQPQNPDANRDQQFVTSAQPMQPVIETATTSDISTQQESQPLFGSYYFPNTPLVTNTTEHINQHPTISTQYQLDPNFRQ